MSFKFSFLPSPHPPFHSSFCSSFHTSVTSHISCSWRNKICVKPWPWSCFMYLSWILVSLRLPFLSISKLNYMVCVPLYGLLAHLHDYCSRLCHGFTLMGNCSNKSTYSERRHPYVMNSCVMTRLVVRLTRVIKYIDSCHFCPFKILSFTRSAVFEGTDILLILRSSKVWRKFLNLRFSSKLSSGVLSLLACKCRKICTQYTSQR
jgi:hypothetical protein